MSRLPIDSIIAQYATVSEQLASTTDTTEMVKLGKQIKHLSTQEDLATKIQKSEHSLAANEIELKDPNIDLELKEMLQTETIELKQTIIVLEDKLLGFLAPEDPRDQENVIVEVRAGAGGDEASLFAGELLDSYRAMCSQAGLSFKMIESSQGTMGGFKDVVVEIKGDNAFGLFKYEGGVHRVQRVPTTEKQGRVHTSTISVVVMPLIESDNTFKLDTKDIEIILSTSSGNGGQSVNTTYSAVRMKHIPTGIEAQSQDERDQQQNRIKALNVLTSRVYDHFEQIRLAKESAERKAQVGNSDRSEKIRTYNFPQDRLTDHRYNHNWNQLPLIMTGGILKVIEDIKKLEAESVLSKLHA
jgi:peptide chain release factor 1